MTTTGTKATIKHRHKFKLSHTWDVYRFYRCSCGEFKVTEKKKESSPREGGAK